MRTLLRKTTKTTRKRAGAKPGTFPGIRAHGKRVVNEDRREECMRLLSLGMYVGDVANALGIHRDTVRQWRDSPDGQARLAAARAERAKAFESTNVAEARRMLLELVPSAVQALAEDLRIGGQRGRAARDILDRVGILRGSELIVKPSIDMSKLSEDVLKAIDEATEKGKAGT